MRIDELPEDILYLILDECRPNGFESAMLSCKRLYYSGEPLIRNHEHCKRLSSDPFLEKTPTGLLVIRDALDFLNHVSTIPLKFQLQILRYFTGVVVFSDTFHNLSCMNRTTLRLEKGCPSLIEVLLHVAKILSSDEHWWAIPDVTLAEDSAAARDISETTEIINLATKQLLKVVLLPLFTNARSIVLTDATSWFDNVASPLPILIRQLCGIGYFDNLEEIFIKQMTQYQYSKLKPLFSLPRLRSLAFEGYADSHEIEPYMEEFFDDSIILSSSLDTMAIFHASWRFDHMELLLQSLPSLKVLVFCENDDMQDYDSYVPSESEEEPTAIEDQPERDDDENASYEEMENELLAKEAAYEDFILNGRTIDGSIQMYYKEAVDYVLSDKISGDATEAVDDFDGEPEDDMALLPDGQNLGEKQGSKHRYFRYFRPSKVVEHIKSTHGNSLQRLGLLNYRQEDPVLIENRFKLRRQLQGFKQLTHLEIDAKLLRSKYIHDPDTLPCLSKVLPFSIQVLSLIIGYPSLNAMVALLGSLPGSLSLFPFLSKILLRLEQFGGIEPAGETLLEEEIIRRLSMDFNDAGVELVVEKQLFFNTTGMDPIRPKIVWENGTCPSIVDDFVPGIARQW